MLVGLGQARNGSPIRALKGRAIKDPRATRVFCRTLIPSPQPFGVGYLYRLPNLLMQRGGSRSSAAGGSPKKREMPLACLIDPVDRLPARFS